MNARFLLLRHVHTPHDKEGKQEIITAWQDVHPDTKGRAEARALAAKLKGEPIAHVISSDLSRAMTLAHAVAQATGATVVPSRYFRPWNIKPLIGRTLADAEPVINNYVKHPDLVMPGGESFNAYDQRWHEGFDLALQAAEDEPECLLVGVTHSTNFKDLHHIATGGKLPYGRNIPEVGHGWIFEKGENGWEARDYSVGNDALTSRVSAQEAGYMELPDAVKDADCAKVRVSGGVARKLGCCNLFELREGAPERFSCGTCQYVR